VVYYILTGKIAILLVSHTVAISQENLEKLDENKMIREKSGIKKIIGSN
jgi:hypothetical protein